MNSVGKVEILGPEGRTEACARFLIDDVTVPFVLKGVCVPGDEYMIGFWVKASGEGRISVGGVNFPVGSEWARFEAGFAADFEDITMTFAAGESGAPR